MENYKKFLNNELNSWFWENSLKIIIVDKIFDVGTLYAFLYFNTSKFVVYGKQSLQNKFLIIELKT